MAYYFLKEDLEAQKTRYKKLLDDHSRYAKEAGEACGEAFDWHDNAAYDLAKAEMNALQGNISDLDSVIKNAVLVEPSTQSTVVEIGNVIKVQADSEVLWLRMGSYLIDQIEGDGTSFADAKYISYNSPWGQAILQKKVGDSFELMYRGQKRKWQIKEIKK